MRKINLKKIILGFAVLMIFGCADGQNKNLTLEDCIYMNGAIFPKRLNNLQWIAGTDYYSFLKNDTLYKGQANDKKDNMLLTIGELQKAYSQCTGGQVAELLAFPSIRWISPNEFRFNNASILFSYNTKTKTVNKLNELPEEVNNIDLSNKNNIYAYTKGNNLYIMKDSQEITIAESHDEGISYGPNDVHRNEFGIEKGTFWSPNDNYLAFYRMDESMVADYPLVEIDTRIAQVENIKYPMAGEASHEVTLGIYDINTGTTVYMQTGEPKDHYLTIVTWDPSEKYIYIGILNREQNHLEFNKYDVATGELVKTLFEEKDDEYVEPLVGPHFLFSDKSKFVYESRRDGWNHLYLYDTNGNMIQQLTKGNWEVQSVIGIDEKEENIFITSTQTSPIQSQIYAVNIPYGYTRRISHFHGTHTGTLSSDKHFLLDKYSSTDIASCIDIIDVNFDAKKLNNNYKVVKTILQDKDPLSDYAIGKMTIGTLKNKNGDSLYYEIILPPDFNPAKKYPVLYYVYGGPHLSLVSDSWTGGAGFWAQRWAERGYIYFSLDNRGTPNRGADFEQCIHGHVGTLEIEDQMIGVDYLKSLPYVDTAKMAVNGWSYGGFMTISLMLRKPGVFKVACAGGPVVDWKWYEVMYGERYMDTPQENPDGYKNASLINYVDNLQGKLLVIHCTTDPVVVWQNSLSLINSFIKANKQVDYFVYPGHDHNVMGKDRIHLYQKMEDYTDTNLNFH